MRRILLLSTVAFAASACAVIPEEPVVQEPVIVAVPPAPTCFDVAQLTRVEVPAETKTVYGVSLIENPPYEPIEQRTEQKIVTKQAEVFYVKEDDMGNQTEVTNLCDPNAEVGPVGPSLGEVIGAPTQG